MKTMQRWKKAMAVATVALFFVAVGLLHAVLGQRWAYDVVKGGLQTYAVEHHEDGSWNAWHVSEPFEKVINENLLVFDAAHYNNIRAHLYHTSYDHTQSEYAFFPLFPLLWRITHLSPIGICILNIALFVLGVAILLLLFRERIEPWMALLTVAMPYLVIFAIPYSEALFFVTAAVGIYGLIKNRYWMFFLGFLLASMTRSASNILLVAWLITDLLLCLREHESWKVFLRNAALHLAPVVSGVTLVILFQRMCGAEHWFQFIESQGDWGKELSWPSFPFSDWSVEGKSVTWVLVFALFIPALAWLATELASVLRSHQVSGTGDSQRLWKTTRTLSVLFFVGNIVLALFTQKGCMYSQARLLTCTPFFLFLVLDIAREKTAKPWRWVVGVCLLATAVYCMEMLWRTDTMGCPITLLLIVLVFYHHWMKPWLRYTLLSITIVLNIFWTAYLFNCFLNGGWIFT